MNLKNHTLNNLLRTSLAFVFLLIGSICFSQDINKTDDQGRKQGKWIKNFEGKSAIKYKGTFKDNVPVGVFIFYYENGKVKAKNRYINGGNDSYISTYHENGKLMSIGKYVNQKKDSSWVYLDQWGNYISKDTYKNGEKHGKCIVFYPFNPKLDQGSPTILEVAFYKYGEKDGDYQKFYKNGKILTQGNYVLGDFEGKVTTYYPTGRKRNVANYRHGIKNGFSYNYDGNEKLTSKQYYRQGHLIEGKELESYLDRMRKRKAKARAEKKKQQSK